MNTELRSFFAAGIGAVVLAGLTGACGDDPEEGPKFKYPTVDAFCAAAAEATCNDAVVEACYQSDAATLPEDKPKCVAARSRGAVCNSKNLPYHPESAEGCVAAYQAVWSDAALTLEEMETLREACITVLSKEGGAGASCAIDEECDAANDLRCVSKPGEPFGKCAVPAEVAGGVECTAAEAQCVDGFFCDAEAGACLQQLGEGKACSASRPCKDDLRCIPDPAAEPPPEGEEPPTTCQPKISNGAACEIDADCKGGFCLETINGKACAAKFGLSFGSSTCSTFL